MRWKYLMMLACLFDRICIIITGCLRFPNEEEFAKVQIKTNNTINNAKNIEPEQHG